MSLFYFRFLSLCLPTLLFAIQEDLVLVEAGSFYMWQEGIQDDEEPLHYVKVKSFEIDRFETKIDDWFFIADWAVENGYDFSDSSTAPWGRPYWYFLEDKENFPMNRVSWYDVIKWCNAKSEYVGRRPVYFSDSTKTQVYRQGESVIRNNMVDWNSNGYRLPTEEEWERAARGKKYNKNYPWGTNIDGSQANYKLSGDPFDDGSSPVGYFNSNQVIAESQFSLDGEKEVPLDVANDYGLYDMTGNLSEWCWDWYDERWYTKKNGSSPSYGPNYSASNSGDKYKVHRGGGYKDGPGIDEGKPLRIAFRHVEYPSKSRRSIGFRTVRSFVEDELWSLSEDLGAVAKNWYYLDWLGYYYKCENGWVFHPELGWIYPTGEGAFDNWIYFPRTGWMWTAKFAYPFFYHAENLQWFLSLQNQQEHGWFESELDQSLHFWGRDYKDG